VKVWVCTAGSYSDYRVHSIYTDEATAKRVSGAFDLNDPIEMEADPKLPQPVRDGLFMYCVVMSKNGDKSRLHRTSYELPDSFKPYVGWQTEEEKGGFLIYCWARDDNHAVKIANERRIQILANFDLWRAANA
jgi:hypothetical protein